MTAAGTCFYFPWEVALEEWLQSTLPGWLMGFVSQLSLFGEQLLMVALLGFLYWGLDKKFGKYLGLNLIMANVWNPMLKNIFLRRRPYFDNEGIQILRVVEPKADIYDIAAQGYSFPSGHSAGAAAVYGSLARYTKKKWLIVLAFLLPFLTGFSRIAVGAHYPTDVLCGWLLGAAAVFLIPLLREKIPNDLCFFGVLLLLTVPGFFYCRSNDYFTGMGMLVGFMAGDLFEKKYVNFENTRSIPRILLRVVGGAGLYFGLNTVLKLPFSSAFLDSGSFASLMVRFGRYAAVIFLVLAVYPMIFRYTDKFWHKAD